MAVVGGTNGEFADFKANALNRTLLHDRSPKGCVDERVVDILQEINRREPYVTMSSCSGKVLFMAYSRGTPAAGAAAAGVLETPLPGRHAVSGGHLRASHDGVADAAKYFSLETEPLRARCEAGDDLWLKFEPFRLDVVCATGSDARRLLGVAKPIFNRGAVVTSATREWRVCVEGNQRLEMPFAFSGRGVYSGSLVALAETVNSKLAKTWACMDRFLEALRQGL